MGQKVLFIGGTGEISKACVNAAVQAGHEVTVFNRGRRLAVASPGVHWIVGDVADEKGYSSLATNPFDVVCQFLAFEPTDIARDLKFFGGNCGQYIFVSSASAYEKPPQSHVITESTPLRNPFMRYSQNKADCESLLREAGAQAQLPFTIVRPSHTYRERLPSTVIDGDHLAWRLLSDQPVIVQGDGESLWTLTHAEDFARAFVQLFGHADALGEDFHITHSQVQTWNLIVRTIGELLGRLPNICHVATDRLVRYEPNWSGPLLGDKANSVIFDNKKISRLTGGWRCEISLREGLEQTLTLVKQRLAAGYQPPPALNRMVDNIVAAQTSELDGL